MSWTFPTVFPDISGNFVAFSCWDQNWGFQTYGDVRGGFRHVEFKFEVKNDEKQAAGMKADELMIF